MRDGSCSGATSGSPSISTTWQPTLSFGTVFGQLHRLGECRTIGHQRGRGHDSADVGLDDGPVYAGGESEIIRIDDQPPHPASLAGAKHVERLHVETAASGCPSSEARLGARSLPAFSSRRVYSKSAMPCGSLRRAPGRLAQLVRAPALQAGGRRFESCTAHHF